MCETGNPQRNRPHSGSAGRRAVLAAASLACIMLLPGAGRAEVFHLQGGGIVEGTWLNRDDTARGLYQIETKWGGRLTLSKDQVVEVETLSDAERQYRELLPRMPHSLDGHWKMAEWCGKAGLKKQRELHLLKVIDLDPNHVEARHALGYSRVDGRWIRPDQWLADQGYVRYKGAWRLPQEVELAAAKDRRQVEESQWRKRVRIWRAVVLRGTAESRAAVEKIRTIDSPLAVAALIDLLDDDGEPPQLKLLYISVLDRFPSYATFGALMRRVMNYRKLEIAEQCLASLRKHGSDEAVTMLSKSLKDKDNRVVNRAAWALGRLENPRAIPALIEAITTKHRFQLRGSGGAGNMNAGFSQTGGSSFSNGPSVKLVEKEIQNNEVLRALTHLTPEGVNFGYNRAAWKNWYAGQQAAGFVNLRRDF